MKVGDVFDMSDFENMATLSYGEDSGYVYVMHNNSTHFHVASSSYTRDTVENTGVILEASVRYDSDSFPEAYRIALNKAVEIACSR